MVKLLLHIITETQKLDSPSHLLRMSEDLTWWSLRLFLLLLRFSLSSVIYSISAIETERFS